MWRCSSESVKSIAAPPTSGAPRPDVRLHPVDDLLRRRTGGEDARDPRRPERLHVGVRDDPAAEHDDVPTAAPLELVDDGGEKRQGRPGEDRETDGARGFLHPRLADDLR